jgi:ketosteroid isomerase-like protein
MGKGRAMKKLGIAAPAKGLILAAIICGALFASAQAQQSTASGVPDKALMQLIWDAWSTRNPDNAAQYYAHGENLVFYPLSPFKDVGWSKYVSGVRTLMADYTSVKITVGDDAQVQHDDKFAFGTTLHATEAFKSGKRDTGDSRWTVVWEKRGNRWLVVHEHVSAPLKAGLESK